jgi:hypothetical protein
VTSQGRTIFHNLLQVFKGTVTILSALVAKPRIRISLAAAVGMPFELGRRRGLAYHHR